MASWVPQQAGLQEILQTIHDSTDSNNTELQRNITLKLNNFTKVPDYIAYLSYVLAHMTQEEDRIRTIAGYLLKNNARLILRSSHEVATFVKESVLQALNESAVMIRNTAGQDVVAFLGVLEPCNWPECLQHLVQALDSPSEDQQEAAFNVLEKACEDYPRKLDIEINGTRPLDYMVPKFLMLAEHHNARMRAHAIACLSYFVPIGSQSLYAHIDGFIATLFKRASDDDSSVRRHVCQSLVMLLASRPDKLMPEMNNVAEYMLYSTRDKNEVVALEACEFWLTFAEDPNLSAPLQPLLPKVAPVLLECMGYGEDDLLWLDTDADDSAVPDKESDIRPRHYGPKTHIYSHDNGDGEGDKRLGAYGEEITDDEDEDDDYDETDEFDEEMSTEWNLRKCAAAALDVLAVRFGADLLNVLLAPLKEKLWSSEWLQRESGILALGAMAEGCIDAIEPHLPTLVPYLINMLNDPKPLVRSITCWTLGRYASWCTQPVSLEHRNQFFIPTLEGLLRMVLDNNKRVQEAGCSAFATLEEDAGPELIPYLEPVLKNLVFAFDKYQHKNMLILYDAVGTLADAVGPALQNPAYVEILMPPLLRRWEKLKNSDEDLIPLLECLSSVTIAIGIAFLPFVTPIFERCMSLVHSSLLNYQQYQQNPELEEPDRSFLVVALDLLSGLTQGLGMAIEPFINASNPNLLDLLTVCLKHPQAPVRQSAYALVGDLAMHCFPLLRPKIPQIMQELVLQLDPEPKVEFISACNNAAWSVGEVALRYGLADPEFAQWVQPLITRLIPILLHPKAPRSLHENAAVSIGRIGLMHASIVAPHLKDFAQAWVPTPEDEAAKRAFDALIAQGELLRDFVAAHKELESYKSGAALPLTGSALTLPAVAAVARYPSLVSDALANALVELQADPVRLADLARSRRIIDDKLAQNKSIYGVSTGFGGSADTRTPEHGALGLALLQHQHSGVLPASLAATADANAADSKYSTSKSSTAALPLSAPLSTLSMPPAWTRAALLVRLNSLLRGHSAASLPLLNAMGNLLAKEITPIVPLRGSISASGDLSPLSYVAGALVGERGIYCYAPSSADASVASDAYANGGEEYSGLRILRAPDALKVHGLTPISLRPKEHLAILNGTAFSCGLAALCVEEARQMVLLGTVCTALGTEAMRGSADSFCEFIQRIESGALLSHLLATSSLASHHVEGGITTASLADAGKDVAVDEETIDADAGTLRQDRYPLRTAPQWLGPQAEVVQRAADVIRIECNSTTDNPLIDPETGIVHHGGNFQAMAVTSALEPLRLALHHVGKLLFAQCTELQNSGMNGGLSGNLAATDPSLNFFGKGIDIAQAAYVAELAYLANPVSTGVQSAEMHNQAVNSLALVSARYTLQALDVLQLLTASYLYLLCQAVDLRALQLRLESEARSIVARLLASHFGDVYAQFAESSSSEDAKKVADAVWAAYDSSANMDSLPRTEKAARAS
ncbi:hypothetical protein EW145_g3006, partial [Phellinidium pouzarii]